MLVGDGKLFLNQATIVAAVQMYLDSKLTEGARVKVTHVTWDRDDEAFNVGLEQEASRGDG